MERKTIARYLHLGSQHTFLIGPRGTGKSTFLRALYPDALWIDLLQPAELLLFRSNPQHLADLVRGNRQKKVIVIDEVQRVPSLLSLVHSLIEALPDVQFVLTGSSARKLKSNDVDLLGGRAVRATLYPFMVSEIEEPISIDELLTHGLLPICHYSVDKRRTLDAYISLYMQEEVYQEALVRNIGDFARFLTAVSFSHAAQLNVTNIASECQVPRKTVEGYLQILYDILLAYELPIFTKRAARQLAATPKFYLFDTGVFQSLRPRGVLDTPQEVGGAALEGLVAQHLRAYIGYQSKPSQLNYWRTRSGTEVDFILYGESEFFALEVKNSERLRGADFTGLLEFKKDYPEATCILLYRGTERLLRADGILCVSVLAFLQALSPKISLKQALQLD